MSLKLKPIHQQVLVITGATRGIGLETVLQALQSGARVFMVAQNEDELQNLQDEMRRKNLPTAYAVADANELNQLQVAADHCLETFGTIDTWINNPTSNILELENGCQVASSILRKSGGAVINVGSGRLVEDYTQTFRQEILVEKAPIAVSLVLPEAIDAKRILKCAVKSVRELKAKRNGNTWQFLKQMRFS